MTTTTDTDVLFSITFTDPDNLAPKLEGHRRSIESAWATLLETIEVAAPDFAAGEMHVSEWSETLPVTDEDTGSEAPGLWSAARQALGTAQIHDLLDLISDATNVDTILKSVPGYSAWAEERRRRGMVDHIQARRDRQGDAEARKWARQMGFDEDYIVDVLGPVPS
jgi:hypothetical protein